MMNKRDLIRRLDQLIENDYLSRSELKLLREIRTVLTAKPHIAKPGPRGPIAIGHRARVDRVLQPSEARIVEHIEAYPHHRFALADLIADLQMPEATVKNCLMRLVQDGYVARPARGFYGPV